MKSHTVCFVIHGPDLVRIARERLLEDDPGHAWRIASCLNGEGSDGVALAVLKGDKTLIGDSSSGIEVIDEDPETRDAYLKRAAWCYAGRIRRDGKWWRPIAEIQDYGPNDMPPVRGERSRLEMRNECKRHQDYARAWHYADLDERVFPEAHDGEFDRAVIWRACGELPHWMTPVLTPRDALAQWREQGRTLDERGHSYKYGVTRLRDDEGEAAFDALVDATLVIDQTAARTQREAEEDAHYAEENRRREAVITEEGGATAHLANVGRERSLPILRWPGALKIWREGRTVRVNVEEHEVSEVREDDVDR